MARMDPPSPPFIFDRALIARRRARYASRFDDHAFLFDRQMADFVERLGAIRKDYPRALIINESGRASAILRADSGVAARIGALVVCDLAPKLVRRAGGSGARPVICDPERLPFAPASFDLVLAPLALHGVNDLPGALTTIRHMLRPDGLFLGGMFCAPSLRPLRQALIAAESALSGGAGPRVAPFADLADLAQLMQRAGFRSPVTDEDRVNVSYDSLMNLLHDLRGMGEAAAMIHRTRRPLHVTVLAECERILMVNHATSSGNPGAGQKNAPRFVMPFHLATLTGWGP